ncbi:MAG: 6-carboxytetrahydropterin synthase QueD [Candidatus Methylopumilus sp.]|jgi:6-pyruvoyltetrahydropterin/6-carboxytetrahydropterin synthase|nr:6-carboxytetrahydropterin synthase QueD [Betaproteobacteria bacterium]
MDITTRLEFDAGHRIPNHKSNCKNLHGHRYAIEVTVTGPIHDDSKSSDFGMVIDFSDVKKIIKDLVVDRWDHAFIVYQDDKEIVNFLNTLPNHKTVIFPVVPTAENMASQAYLILSIEFNKRFNHQLKIKQIRMYETPNSWADAV